MTLLFPCFGINFLGNEKDILLNEYEINIEKYFQKASNYLKIDCKLIEKAENEFLEEIKIFVYSAAVSDFLKLKKLRPNYLSYYSMGIYAALYFSNSIDFETALSLIKNVYEISLWSINKKNNNYKIAYIIGLSLKDILDMLNTNKFQIEIINLNNEYSVVITGVEKDIYLFVEKVKEEGALKAVVIKNSQIPFHSSFIKDAISLYIKMLEKINIYNSSIPLISSIDQKIFSEKEEIKNEILNNIINQMNWYKTFCRLLDIGEKTFIEAGPGESFSKIAKFITGEFKIYTLKELNKVLCV